MALFTVEVSGRPVLVFSEGNRRAAEELLASAIGPDLLDFEEEEGRPVWDGEEGLTVREAHPEEAARWGFGAQIRISGFGETRDGSIGSAPSSG